MQIGYSEIVVGKIDVVQNAYFQNRIHEYSGDKEKYRTYISYVILKKLAKNIGFDLDNVEILRDQNGKPYAKNNEFFFNISHSENIVVVVIDDGDIGVDIEYIRPYDLRIAQKFFNDKVDQITSSAEPDIEFTKQWTIFEAQLKYYGSIELLRKNVKPNTISTKLSDSNNKYILTVATKKKNVEKSIKIEKI